MKATRDFIFIDNDGPEPRVGATITIQVDDGGRVQRATLENALSVAAAALAGAGYAKYAPREAGE